MCQTNDGFIVTLKGGNTYCRPLSRLRNLNSFNIFQKYCFPLIFHVAVPTASGVVALKKHSVFCDNHGYLPFPPDAVSFGNGIRRRFLYLLFPREAADCLCTFVGIQLSCTRHGSVHSIPYTGHNSTFTHIQLPRIPVQLTMKYYGITSHPKINPVSIDEPSEPEEPQCAGPDQEK